MTELKLLKKAIRNYHRLLAMYALTPLLIFCLFGVYLLFHDKSYLYDNLPMMACYAACTLMSFLGIMSMSYDYLPEIIRLVNDSWAYSIEHELKPKMEKTLCEDFKEGILDLYSKGYIIKTPEDVQNELNIIKDTIELVRECQKSNERMFEMLNEGVEMLKSDEET